MLTALEPCRRRKIRCILAYDDSRKRCVTCIRLKKTCAFHPPKRQHGYTGRFQTSDKFSPTADTSAATSSSFNGQNLGRVLDNAEHLRGVPTSNSTASFSSNDSWNRPWGMLPKGLVCGISGFQNGAAPPINFQPDLAYLWPWNYLDNLSSDQVDDSSHSSWQSKVMVSPEVCGQSHSANAAVWLPSQYNISASYPSSTMPLGQPYIPNPPVKLPTSSPTAEQRGHQEPL